MRSLTATRVKTVAAAALLAAGLLGLCWSLMLITRPARRTEPLALVALTIIPAPTETPMIPTPLPATPATASDLPSAPGAGVLYVGAYVQISGTGGEGLRIRQGPGLSYEQRYLGMEAEVFKIVGGPQEADGYTWWQLVAPYDDTISGWAVSNYLDAVDAP